MNTDVRELAYNTLQHWQATDRPLFLIDLREQYERDQFHIGGTRISLNDINRYTGDLPNDRPIVVYCKRGIRSKIAIQRWQQKRADLQLYNLSGGLAATFPQVLKSSSPQP